MNIPLSMLFGIPIGRRRKKNQREPTRMPGDSGAETNSTSIPTAPEGAQLVRLLKAALTGLVVFVIMLLLVPLPGAIRIVGSVFTAGVMAAMVYFAPLLQDGRRGDKIDQALPFFITHFGVLATSNMPRNDMLRILSTNEEYKEIAREMGRIYRLTTEWGLSLSDSIRAVSQTSPSPVFSDFLLRMAHALESGQNLEAFLQSEQGVVMREYAAIYDASLLKVDNWKELYTNTVMTVGFMAVFAVIVPLIAGGSIVTLMLGVALITLVLEILMGITLRERLPTDRLRPNRPIQTGPERRIRMALLAATGMGFLIYTLLISSQGAGMALLVASVPFIVPGIMAQREEQATRRREEDFPAFIRSVGAAAAARGGGVREVLEHVQANKLGALTEIVRALYRRLSWRIADTRAWTHFGAESGSRLVDSFTDMFIQGVRAGGKPGIISQIISDNMIRIMALRTSRRATAGAFRGMLMGLAGGLALVVFVGSGVFDLLLEIFGGFGDVLAQQSILKIDLDQDPTVVPTILFWMLAFHSVASGIFFKLVDGGRLEASTLNATLHIWISIGVALATSALMPQFLGSAGGDVNVPELGTP